MPKTRDIIAELEELLKTAAAKASKAAAAPGVAGMPGSEHDQTTSVRPGDPEAAQLMPAGARTNSGAGDNSQLTRGHLKDATQPSSATTSAPQPVISGDLGKTAALGNDILRAAAAAATLAKQASDAPVDRINESAGDKPKTPKLKDSAEPSAAAPAGSKPMISGSAEAKTAAAPAVKPAAAQGPASKGASAAPGQLELTPDIYQKIGMLLCSSDEGLETVCAVLEKQAGMAAAQDALAKVAEFQQQQAAADAGDDYFAIFSGRDTMTARKLGQLAAQEAMADAVQGGDAPAMGTGDAEVLGAIEQLVADGTIEPQVAEALAQLAQSGQLQALLGDAGGGAPLDAGGAALPDGGGSAMPGAEGAAMPGAGGDPIAAMLGGTGGADGGGAMPGPSNAQASSGEQSDVGGGSAPVEKPKEDKPKEDKPKEDKSKDDGAESQ